MDYFFNARQDQLARYYGFDLFGAGHGYNWIVSRSHIAYLWPARLNEQVRLLTRLIQLTDRTLLVEGLLLDQEARHLKAVLPPP